MTDFDVQIHSVVVDGKEYFMEEVLGDEPLVLGDLYITNAFGHKVYIKCRDRLKAQQIVDAYYGSGFYVVKSVRGAKGADKVTVKSVGTRKGQYFQAQKARILNS